MKILIIIIAALVFSIWFGLASLNDPGLVTIARAPYFIELPLALLVLASLVAFAVLYLLCGFLFGMLRVPKKAQQWQQRRQGKQAQKDTLRGYVRLIEGDWHSGEKYLAKHFKHCQTPLLNYLGAAYAAQQQGDFAKRDAHLEEAETSDPDNRMAVDLARVRLWSQAGDYARVKTLLAAMHAKVPANKRVLILLAQAYKNAQDWQPLLDLLPKLEKRKAVERGIIGELEVLARTAQMGDSLGGDSVGDSVGDSLGGKTTMQAYQALPRKRKTDAAMAAMYAKKLIQEGELNAAEAIVRKAIAKKWTSELADLYGKTKARDGRQQISLATTWLAEHDDEAMVHLSLARLNGANEQAEKAKTHYEKAIKLGAGSQAYYELGAYFEAQGDVRLARDYYKKGLQAAIATAATPLSSELLAKFDSL